MKEAKLIATAKYAELRHGKKEDCWPGGVLPLNRQGYWAGSDKQHEYLGPSKAEALRLWALRYDRY